MVGWLVALMLSLMLLVPVLLLIAYLVPAYQARQAQQHMHDWQANSPRLTMTWDKALPILEVRVDSATYWVYSNDPIELPPIERPVSPGKHNVIVIYKHGERKRSVREAIDLAEGEKRTLDFMPLVERDIEARAAKAAKKTEAEARSKIESDRPDRPVELGWRIEPRKESYAIGDWFTVTLFLRNTRTQPIGTSVPRLEILEKLGLGIELRDAEGAEVPWRWEPTR